MDGKNAAEKTSAGNLSVAQTILAILWQATPAEAAIRTFYPHPYSQALCQNKSKSTFRSSFSRLAKKGFIKPQGRATFALTTKGKEQARYAFVDAERRLYQPDLGAKWDGGWRIVFFDIPEKLRRHRDFLRACLKAVGFRHFQKSVWVCPLPVPVFLRDLLFEEGIKQYARFVTTAHIEYDLDLRKMFPETFFKDRLVGQTAVQAKDKSHGK